GATVDECELREAPDDGRHGEITGAAGLRGARRLVGGRRAGCLALQHDLARERDMWTEGLEIRSKTVIEQATPEAIGEHGSRRRLRGSRGLIGQRAENFCLFPILDALEDQLNRPRALRVSALAGLGGCAGLARYALRNGPKRGESPLFHCADK